MQEDENEAGGGGNDVLQEDSNKSINCEKDKPAGNVKVQSIQGADDCDKEETDRVFGVHNQKE